MARSDSTTQRLNSATSISDLKDEEYDALRTRASLFRSVETGPLSANQVARLARHLEVDRATIYRWYAFRRARTISSLKGPKRGYPELRSRLRPDQELIIVEAMQALARQRRAELRVVDVVAEVAQRCRASRVPIPSRRSIDLRLKRSPELAVRRLNASAPVSPKTAPGSYVVRRPLDVVQIDHTMVDLVIVDDLYRTVIPRPYLTVAVDIASRAVLAFAVSSRQPNAATVALCLARAAQSKTAWLESLGVEVQWPVEGLPKSLHLDNAAEFHSKALDRGCAEFGIELLYRPRGRPHFGGHVERFVGALMNRLRTLPGATGASVKGRKARAPERKAVMTLREFEAWLALEIAGVYHVSEHRGLRGGSPIAAWEAKPPAPLSQSRQREVFLAFLPGEERTVRRDGIHFESIKYWHPVFTRWAPRGKKLFIHYDPNDLSKLFARMGDDEVLEIPYADLRHPPISIWEQRAAASHLRKAARGRLNEQALFDAIEQQRAIVTRARAATQRKRSGGAFVPMRTKPARASSAKTVTVTRAARALSQPAAGGPVVLDIDVSKLSHYVSGN